MAFLVDYTEYCKIAEQVGTYVPACSNSDLEEYSSIPFQDFD